MVYQLCHKLGDRSLTPAVCGKHQNWVPSILLTSESKKPGQIAVVYHYYDLSRFFWLRRYIICDLFSWGLSKKKFCLKKQNPKWPTQKKISFLKSPILQILLWNFHGLVLYGWETVQHKLKNRQKMHFLCFWLTASQPYRLSYINAFCISQSYSRVWKKLSLRSLIFWLFSRGYGLTS